MDRERREVSSLRQGESRVLVTGGAGFIGSHLVDRLIDEGYRVCVLDDLSRGSLQNLSAHRRSKRLRFVKGDVRDARLVSKLVRNVHAVFHQAAIVDIETSMEDPALVHDVNVGGTLNLLDACRRSDVERFVYSSSSSVYGEAKSLPIPEDSALEPISPYGASKLAAEKYCTAFAKAYGFKAVCLRYFNVFGPRQSDRQYSGVITAFIKRVLRGRPPVIFGDGEQTRDFVSVGDVVEANVLALEEEGVEGDVFNVGTGRSTSVKRLADQLLQISGRRSVRPVYTSPRPGEIRHSLAEIEKARTRLGYEPRTNLDGDLRKLFDWYSAHASRKKTLRD